MIVITGDDKGKKREVRFAYPKKGTVIVDGSNFISKHQKPDAKNPDGGIIKMEAPIKLSNVMLVDPKTGERTRIGRRNENGKSVRYAKKSGEVIK